MVVAYKRESQRQKELICKARICESKLLFIVTAFNQLLANQAFVKLLEAGSVATMPQNLWSKLNHEPKEAT
jgi:ParB family chromosome partitioning protein